MDGKAAADRGSARDHQRLERRLLRVRSTVALLVAVGALAACSSSSSATATTQPGGAVATSPTGVTTPGSTGTATTTSATATASPTTTARGTTSSSAAATTTIASTTTTTLPPTTTTLPMITEGGVVIVANASGINGAAASITDTLNGVGFHTVKATNAAGYEETLDTSKVYFAPEAYGVAYTIARLMGGVAVAPMPTPPPIYLALEGLRGANVIVMLGKDLAGQPLPGLP